MTEPRGDAGGHEGAAAELECPSCGSPASPRQDYCLECGARLPPAVAAAGAAGRLQGGARESLVTVLAAFVVAVIAAAAVVAVQVTRDDGEHPFLVATNEDGLTEPETDREPPLETALPPEEEDEELPAEEEPLEEEPEPPPQQQALIPWPEGTDGFTVILASLPSAGGRAPATARAQQARDAGLPEVGVLLSSEFASLQPGYFVVFSGVYETRPEADAAVAAARDAGHPDAYVGRIAP